MLAILTPFVLSALKSPKFKVFVVELLEKLVAQTDNDLDDKALVIAISTKVFSFRGVFKKYSKKVLVKFGSLRFIFKIFKHMGINPICIFKCSR